MPSGSAHPIPQTECGSRELAGCHTPAGPGHVEIQTQGEPEPGWRGKSKTRLGPGNRGLTPCPIPAVPLGFHTGLHWPLGVPWLRCPGKIVPKLCFIGPVPGKLLGVSARTRGGALGVCWSPVCAARPRLRPGWSVQDLCLGQAGLWALSDRERTEEGMRQVREERRRRGSKGSRRGSDIIKRWMLTQKEERRTKHDKEGVGETGGRRESEPGKPRPGSFSLGWAWD